MELTLERLLNSFTHLAIEEKLVNYAASASSFNTINGHTIKEYPVIFIQPRGQHTYTEDRTTYSLNLYYIDRLLSDDSNDINIYSTAIEELKHFLKKIKEQPFVLEVSDTIYFENFVDTHGKNDRVAGCYCSITVTVPNDSICYED